MIKNLILLHGALGSEKQLEPLKNLLLEEYKTYSFNFWGHGGSEIPSSLRMPNLVEQLETFMNAFIPKEEELTIFGYSMGGYAALMLAAKNSCKIDRIVTLGTKLYWDKEVAAKEIKMLDPNTIEEKIPVFAQELKNRHSPSDWKLLMNKTADLMIDLGEQQYLHNQALENIQCNCKLMIGDKDKMVTLDETIHAFKHIKGASLSVLPSTIHPIEKVNLDRLVFELKN